MILEWLYGPVSLCRALTKSDNHQTSQILVSKSLKFFYLFRFQVVRWFLASDVNSIFQLMFLRNFIKFNFYNSIFKRQFVIMKPIETIWIYYHKQIIEKVRALPRKRCSSLFNNQSAIKSEHPDLVCLIVYVCR